MFGAVGARCIAAAPCHTSCNQIYKSCPYGLLAGCDKLQTCSRPVPLSNVVSPSHLQVRCVTLIVVSFASAAGLMLPRPLCQCRSGANHSEPTTQNPSVRGCCHGRMTMATTAKDSSGIVYRCSTGSGCDVTCAPTSAVYAYLFSSTIAVRRGATQPMAAAEARRPSAQAVWNLLLCLMTYDI